VDAKRRTTDLSVIAPSLKPGVSCRVKVPVVSGSCIKQYQSTCRCMVWFNHCIDNHIYTRSLGWSYPIAKNTHHPAPPYQWRNFYYSRTIGSI